MNQFLCMALLCLFFTQHTFGQCKVKNTISVLSGGPAIKETVELRKPVPYPHLREADVMWSKRVWRTLDLKQKLNHPLYFPPERTDGRCSLFDIIKTELQSETNINVYDPGIDLDDEFRYKMSSIDIKRVFSSFDTIPVENLETGLIDMIPVQVDVESADVKRYWIKEDWFFDKQRSVMDVRIIGIAPLVEDFGSDGEARGFRPLFWIYFPEWRYVFATYRVYIAQNDAAGMSFDDLFQKRMFASYIHKESNAYDRNINQYKLGIDALLESERVKSDIFIMEHDMWSY